MSGSKRYPDIRLEATQDGQTWELFHENSKTSRYDAQPSIESIRARMAELWESLPYTGYPATELPVDPSPLGLSLLEAIRTRETAREMSSTELDLRAVGTMLELSYGTTRSNEDNEFPWPFRTVPSAGALYPLEIYFHSARIEGVRAGIHHYDPSRREIRRIRDGDFTRELSEALVQPNIAVDAAMVFFITAVFERSAFKYGDRGYRFTLLEAGHVAQNLNLVANGLGLGSINIGGFYDRQVDDILRIDGIAHSTVYMVAVGARGRRGA